nr:MAG TPA: Transcription initiation factor IIE, alpha FINGER, Transcription [Caudoviricetes sp.]
MRIIKPGSCESSSEFKIFTCNRCGCEFEASCNEYEPASCLESMYGVVSKCRCPYCGNEVSSFE